MTRKTQPRKAAALLFTAALLTTMLPTSRPVRADSTETPEPEVLQTADALKITAENPQKGHYRLQGNATLEAAPQDLLTMLTAYEQHCMEGCRYPLPSLAKIDIIKQEGDRTITWTRVDDLMDAHYFTAAEVEQDPMTGSVSLTLDFLEDSDLEGLITPERPHDPFFHQQRVIWQLSPTESGTEVSVSMEMRSKRFLINLMPSQVLEGSQNYLEKVFAHLREINADD